MRKILFLALAAGAAALIVASCTTRKKKVMRRSLRPTVPIPILSNPIGAGMLSSMK